MPAIICTVVAGACLSLGPSQASAAPDCDWGYSITVDVQAGPSGFAQEARIDLASGDFPTGYVMTPAGDDVRVYIGGTTTPVTHAVTAWDPLAGTATIFIRPPAIAPNASFTAEILFGNTTVGPASDPQAVFPTDGVRLRSRVSTADPTDAAGALAAFNAATVDVYDQIRTTVSGLNNGALGGSNGNFGWCVSAMLEVTPATAGTWSFRYGADFGHGGHLYVGETALEEDWNDDLWWANNYANTSETLSGSIDLGEGWHRFEALGFEGCCDGAVGFQAQAPGGSFQDLSSTNFRLRGSQCISPEVTITSTNTASCTIDLTADKSYAFLSDPLGSSDPFAVPGTRVSYSITVENRGIAIDADTIDLVDTLPPDAALVVDGAGAFTLDDGVVASGMTLDWGGYADASDDVLFSTDGTNYAYTPVVGGNGTDQLVTHIRLLPKGRMNGVQGSDRPSFSIQYEMIVR